ncbi:NYN domain-containing protein [Zhenpiania hominis]|uniref:NYN domain-containing protein n=1 Tax=Zhenpiania hominis TaxID=2763644 RepID=UPI0039F51DAB
MEKRFALLIDADNVSAKYIDPILDELSKYGNVTYKRIYGDWTSRQNSSWKEELLTSSITPIQQFSYTTGKNATDSALIIDAMDILYTNTVDGFCIVSSDSDFTKLASRIRESGLTVIGMGENKTPMAFRKACDIFTRLELLEGENEAKEEVKEDAGVKDIDKSTIEDAIVKIITENTNNGRETGLAELGNRLLKLYPDFDVRSYGYSLLSKLLEEFPKIRLLKKGNYVSVKLAEGTNVEEFIRETVRSAGRDGLELGALGQEIHQKFDNFNVQDYGFSQFKKYIRSIGGIEVRKSGSQNMVRYRENG